MNSSKPAFVFPWRELLIALLLVILVFQLSPDLTNRLLKPLLSNIASVMDVRKWSVATWLSVQAVVLVVLVFLRMKYQE